MTPPPVPSPLAADLGFLLARTSGLAVRAVNAALEPLGLRARHVSLLRLVADEARSQREIGAVLGLDPSNVVTLVDELETQGLLRRAPDPRDRRARLVGLTAEGRRRLATAGEVADAALVDVVAGLSGDERARLVAILGAVVGGRP